MVDLEKLKETISESGMTVTAISEKSGILRATLYNRLDGVGEFTASEIYRLGKAMRLTRDELDEIFFAEKVE